MYGIFQRTTNPEQIICRRKTDFVSSGRRSKTWNLRDPHFRISQITSLESFYVNSFSRVPFPYSHWSEMMTRQKRTSREDFRKGGCFRVQDLNPALRQESYDIIMMMLPQATWPVTQQSSFMIEVLWHRQYINTDMIFNIIFNIPSIICYFEDKTHKINSHRKSPSQGINSSDYILCCQLFKM